MLFTGEPQARITARHAASTWVARHARRDDVLFGYEPLFLEAWQRGLAAGEDFYAVDAAHMLGICAPSDQRLTWNLKALDLAEQSADPRANKWLGSLYNNIGWTYHEMGDYQQALEIFQKAVQWREAAGREQELRIARWCLARTLRSLDRVEEALAIQRSLLAALERSGEQDGYVYQELAECLLALEQPDAARPYFALAYQALAQDLWLVENEPARVERLKVLGNVG
jgi:tetratricopeptide (TPR) repeat protein